MSWAYRVRTSKDSKGRWREQRRSGFETKREAERALTEVVAALHEGSFVQTTSMTLAEFLIEEWLPATAPPQVKYETWQDRTRNLEQHVVEHIGDLRLQDLNAADLNRLYAKLLKEGRRDDTGGLSPTTVRRIHAMLRKALNDAVRWGLLERNIVPLADPPPNRVVQASRRRSMRTWNYDELRTFLDSTHDHGLHPLFVVAAFTGMRRSELLGLRWDNVDLSNALLVVRGTVVPGEDGYEVTEDQKTAGSARTLHLDDRTLRTLEQQRLVLEARRRMVSPLWKDHDLVFPREDGSWWNPPAVSLAFRRAVKKADVPKIRFHDLRHTHATLLLKAGVNPKVVSERLGHSSVAFTLDTYAHVMPGMQAEAAELLSQLVYDPDNASN